MRNSFYPLLLAGLSLAALPSCVEHYQAYDPGYTVTTLPSGYVTETVGGVRYYRANNVYYKSAGGRYTVVPSPYGGRTYGAQSFSDRGSRASRDHSSRGTAVMRRLPRGASVQIISGTRYYVHDGVYYRPQGSGYIIVDRPR